jgi:hypothetical protein
MANIVEQLRKLSEAHRKRIDNAATAAEKMKIAAEAARKVAREVKSEKG